MVGAVRKDGEGQGRLRFVLCHQDSTSFLLEKDHNFFFKFQIHAKNLHFGVKRELKLTPDRPLVLYLFENKKFLPGPQEFSLPSAEKVSQTVMMTAVNGILRARRCQLVPPPVVALALTSCGVFEPRYLHS